MNRFTIIGAVVGFAVTRFFPDGNLLITNVVALVFALTFRTIFKLFNRN